jgi:hypothetical protein
MTQNVSSKIVDANYLTGVLRRCGVLSDGCVTEVTLVSSRPRIERLRLPYDQPEAGAPFTLVHQQAWSEVTRDGDLLSGRGPSAH